MDRSQDRQDEAAATLVSQPWYTIAPSLFEAQGRSARMMALHRRCARCWGTLYQKANVLAAFTFEQHRKRIAECCSTQADYTTPEMPVLEVVFRLLLAMGEKGLTLEELHEAMSRPRGATGMPRGLSAEALRRMIVHDRYYGIRETLPELEAPAVDT